MANTVQHKRSSTASAVPTGAQLALGELAVNTNDGRLFLKKGDGTVVAIGRDASELNTGTVAAARLPAATASTLGAIIVGTGLGVSSGTVSVSYGSTGSVACVGNDSRLSCQAWVNFNGTSSAALTGTYSQTGSTITVTITGHGLTAGQAVWLSFTSGTATTTGFVVATVTSSSVFTVTAGDSKTTTGNVTATRRTIRASYNVSSVAYLAIGDYWVNLSTAMSDPSYAVIATAGGTANAFLVRAYDDGTARSTWAFRLLCVTIAAGNAGIDPLHVSAAVFR